MFLLADHNITFSNKEQANFQTYSWVWMWRISICSSAGSTTTLANESLLLPLSIPLTWRVLATSAPSTVLLYGMWVVIILRHCFLPYPFWHLTHWKSDEGENCLSAYEKTRRNQTIHKLESTVTLAKNQKLNLLSTHS